MPTLRRRDGQTVVQQQQDGKGPSSAVAGPSPAEQAAAALATTHAAVQSAAAAPPVIAPAVTVAAINSAAAGILGAFDRFLASRRADQETYVTDVLESELPDLPAETRQAVVSAEMSAELAYATKVRQRLDRDLPKALSIADPRVRESEVQKILTRERRFAEMREAALATRTLGTAEQRQVERLSPEGGFWDLSDHAKTHTADCVAMSGKVWPHSVLRTYHPPLHGGCGCRLRTIQEARQMGKLRSPEQIATPDQSLLAMQIAEAEFDEAEFEEEVRVLEAQARWWKGTAGPGQFRSRRGDLGAGLRRAQARIPVVTPAEPVRELGDEELRLRELQTKDLGRGARVMVEGELRQIRAVLAPGIFELEDGSTVRVTGDTAFGIPGEPADVSEADAGADTTPEADAAAEAPSAEAQDADQDEREREQETLQVTQTEEESVSGSADAGAQ